MTTITAADARGWFKHCERPSFHSRRAALLLSNEVIYGSILPRIALGYPLEK